MSPLSVAAAAAPDFAMHGLLGMGALPVVSR